MYLAYVDESGDPGQGKGGTPFFVISGIIIHEIHWNEVFARFLDLRRNLSRRHLIPQRTPFHATDIVNGHGDYHHTQYGFTTQQRFDFYREILEFLSQTPQIKILNIFINKRKINDKDIDVFEQGWSFFIQRFHTFLEKGGHLRQKNAYGMLVTDRTNDDKLRALMRKMRAFNYVPSRFSGSESRRILVTRLLDDPVPRASPHSYYIQMADLVAYALARRAYKRPLLSQHGFDDYFLILDPILLKEATAYDPHGVVFWPR